MLNRQCRQFLTGTPRAVHATAVECTCLCGDQGHIFSILSNTEYIFFIDRSFYQWSVVLFYSLPTPPPLLYHSKRSGTVFTKSIGFKWTRYALDFLDLSSCARKLAKCNNLFLAPSDCNKWSIIILYTVYIITPVHVESQLC